MEKLPPIPSPPGTAFREFRIGLLPYAVFLAALAATVFVWKDYVGPNALVGEVEMIRQIVSAPQPSRVTKLLVSPLDPVTTGQPVAEIMAADPKYLDAQASLARARLEFLRVTVEPKIRRENNRINYTQLRLDWFRQRVELAALKAQLAYHEAEVDRVARLSKITNGTPFVSIQDLQIAQRDLESLRAQIQEQSALVAEVEGAFQKLNPDEKRDEDDFPGNLTAALAVEQKAIEAIESQLSPVVLLSPIDGFVSAVHRRTGEAVMPGEPIVTVSIKRSDRITAFIRQPVRIDVQKGMSFEIRSRSLNRAVAVGEVIAVGGQMEPILPELLPMRPNTASNIEYGLPIVVRIPPELALVPGEIVDLAPKR